MGLHPFFLLFLVSFSRAIRGPPRISAPVSDSLPVKIGQTVRLPCPAQGNPTPLTAWTKNGESITMAWTRFKINNRSLKIYDVSGEDSGTYTCTAVNGFGSQQISIKLIVDECLGSSQKPKITSETNQDVLQRPVNTDVRLKCGAQGTPAPNMSWYKDGHPIPNINDRQRVLYLQRLQRGDSGLYMCLAQNTCGQDSRNFTLHVIARVRSKPELSDDSSHNVTVKLGELASLQCKIRSEAKPHVQWLKEVLPGQNIFPNRTFEVQGKKYHVLKGSAMLAIKHGVYLNKFQIPQAQLSQSGLYICFAANKMGYNIRESYLTVLPENVEFTHSKKSSLSSYIGAVVTIPVIVVCCVAIAACHTACRRKLPAPSPPTPESQCVFHYSSR